MAQAGVDAICYSQSKRFSGVCFSSSNCAHVCQSESNYHFTGGTEGSTSDASWRFEFGRNSIYKSISHGVMSGGAVIV
ncbi:hypothetical protein EJ110_NYTH07662 [Nymphaea thermarum]|nr:hypothetical protein EJ110_NYTH07662 [Nymphaea thermarum]